VFGVRRFHCRHLRRNTLAAVGMLAALVAATLQTGAGFTSSEVWRFVQTSNGSVYAVHDGVRQLVIPAAISDEDLQALQEDTPIGGDAVPGISVSVPQFVTLVATPTPYPVLHGPMEFNGQRVSILDIKRPVGMPPKPGLETVGISLRLDNPTTTPMRTNPLQFVAQGSDLVIYEAMGHGPNELHCCEAPAGLSVAGTIYFQMPIGVAHQKLIWEDVKPQQVVDIS
jgi:hypothetical protein